MIEIWMDCGRDADEGQLVHSGMGVVEFYLPEEVVLYFS